MSSKMQFPFRNVLKPLATEEALVRQTRVEMLRHRVAIETFERKFQVVLALWTLQFEQIFISFCNLFHVAVMAVEIGVVFQSGLAVTAVQEIRVEFFYVKVQVVGASEFPSTVTLLFETSSATFKHRQVLLLG